jgi:hypothetical protein
VTVEEYRENLIHAMHEAGRDEFITLVVLPHPSEFQYLKHLLKNYSRRRKGEWRTAFLDHEAIGMRPKVLYCSECSQCVAYPTKYCPNCGAFMDGR